MAAKTDKESFLAACFMSIAEPKVDFEQVAKDSGMSIGGAKNKLRSLLKEFENKSGDTTEAKAKPKAAATAASKPAPKRKAAAAKKTVSPTSNASDGEEVSGDNVKAGATTDAEEPAKKKQKTSTAAKKPAARKKEKPVPKSLNTDDEGDGAASEKDIVNAATDGDDEPEAPVETKKPTGKAAGEKKGIARPKNAKAPAAPKEKKARAPATTTAAKAGAKSKKGNSAKEDDDVDSNDDDGVVDAAQTDAAKDSATETTTKSKPAAKKRGGKTATTSSTLASVGAGTKVEVVISPVPAKSVSRKNTPAPEAVKDSDDEKMGDAEKEGDSVTVKIDADIDGDADGAEDGEKMASDEEV